MEYLRRNLLRNWSIKEYLIKPLHPSARARCDDGRMETRAAMDPKMLAGAVEALSSKFKGLDSGEYARKVPPFREVRKEIQMM